MIRANRQTSRFSQFFSAKHVAKAHAYPYNLNQIPHRDELLSSSHPNETDRKRDYPGLRPDERRRRADRSRLESGPERQAWEHKKHSLGGLSPTERNDDRVTCRMRESGTRG